MPDIAHHLRDGSWNHDALPLHSQRNSEVQFKHLWGYGVTRACTHQSGSELDQPCWETFTVSRMLNIDVWQHRCSRRCVTSMSSPGPSPHGKKGKWPLNGKRKLTAAHSPKLDITRSLNNKKEIQCGIHSIDKTGEKIYGEILVDILI